MTRKSGKDKTSRRKTAASAPAPAIEATRLLGKWLRIAQGHVSFGMRCSCGIAAGGGSVQVQDFELQILDYIFGKHGTAELAMLRARAGYRPAEAGSITELLRAIAIGASDIAAEPQLALLRDLDRSVDSFGELHRR